MRFTSSGSSQSRSLYPWPCACVGMFTGMPATKLAKSVPWSRLKPRRKYWFALPSPLCCVTITPGTNSSTSAGRSVGRLSISFAVTLPWLAASELPTALS